MGGEHWIEGHRHCKQKRINHQNMLQYELRHTHDIYPLSSWAKFKPTNLGIQPLPDASHSVGWRSSTSGFHLYAASESNHWLGLGTPIHCAPSRISRNNLLGLWTGRDNRWTEPAWIYATSNYSWVSGTHYSTTGHCTTPVFPTFSDKLIRGKENTIRWTKWKWGHTVR